MSPVPAEQRSPNLPALFDAVIDARRSVARSERREARDHSPKANIFDLLGTDELSLSLTFAWLLDPRGTHGQGDAFLRSFVQRFLPSGFADGLASDRVLVRTEVVTLDGRGSIDMLVEWPGQAAVAIENKPRAAFQERQLPRYVEDVARRAPARHRLVALMGWEGDAAEYCDAHFAATGDGALRDRCEAADFRAVLDWIADARAHARSTRMTDILAQFEEHLERFYVHGGEQMTDDLIVEYALTSPERLQAAAALLASAGRIKRRVAADARDRALRELARYRPDEQGFADGVKSGWMSFDVGADRTRLYLWFDKGDFRDLSFGLRDASRENDEREVRRTDLSLVLENRFGSSQYGRNGWSYWRLPRGGPTPFSCSDPEDTAEFLPWLASPAFVDDAAKLIDLLRTRPPA